MCACVQTFFCLFLSRFSSSSILYVFNFVGNWYENYTIGADESTGFGVIRSSGFLEDRLNSSFSTGGPSPRLYAEYGLVGWRRAEVMPEPTQPEPTPSEPMPTEPPPEESKSFFETAGGISTLTVVTFILVFIILLLTKRLYDAYGDEKKKKSDDSTKLMPGYDGWQHPMYPGDSKLLHNYK